MDERGQKGKETEKELWGLEGHEGAGRHPKPNLSNCPHRMTSLDAHMYTKS